MLQQKIIDKLESMNEKLETVYLPMQALTEAEQVSAICSFLYRAYDYRDRILTKQRLKSGLSQTPFEFIRWYIEWENSLNIRLAYVYVSIVAYCHNNRIPLEEKSFDKESTGSVMHDLLRINWYIINAFHKDEKKDWNYTLSAIKALCLLQGLFLEESVDVVLKSFV